MKRIVIIPALILICGLDAFSPVFAWEWEEERAFCYWRELLFDLAELHYPEFFTTHEVTLALKVQETVEEQDRYGSYSHYWNWFYRYYPGSDTYLAVNEKENAVYVFGTYFGPEITKVGAVEEVLRLFPSSMNSSFSDECVEVGSLDPGTTAYYGWTDNSPGPFFLFAVPDRTEGDSVVSWLPGAGGSTEVLTHHGSFLNYLHLYTEKEIVTSNTGLNYRVSSSRTYAAAEFSAEPGWHKASETTQYSPGLLLGPSSRYCVGQTWLSASVAESSTYSYFPTTTAVPMPPSTALTETALSLSYVVNVKARIKVQAGEFDSVEIITMDPENWTGHTRWVDVATGILIKDGPANTYTTPATRQSRELYLLQASGRCTLTICGEN
ncbi:MAG: hypothetical protein R3F41_00475 [Gammaproteobacteria bacterium]|nr:hypothetical protein [Pseudomonadales bacterium]